jgi:hypothetical protein
MSDRDQYEHAKANAKNWYETIRDLYREVEGDEGLRWKLHECGNCEDFAKCQGLEMCQLGDTSEREEQIKTEVQEGPLSLLVREPWHQPGDSPKPSEYELLLTTGGPGLRIWGDIDLDGEPENARLEMQDWGLPWREVWPCEVEEMNEYRAALLWYAGHFYFGE